MVLPGDMEVVRALLDATKRTRIASKMDLCRNDVPKLPEVAARARMKVPPVASMLVPKTRMPALGIDLVKKTASKPASRMPGQSKLSTAAALLRAETSGDQTS